MALRQLTEADCGQSNAIVQLTSHLTQDHGLRENYRQNVFPSSSDQLVEQFLAETRAAPQSFRMDDLMREMHEIESQRASLPPVPAVAIKDHLHDNNWALEYSKQSDHGPFGAFDVAANEAVWAEISARERDQSMIDNQWFQEYDNNFETNQQLIQSDAMLNSTDDPKFAYSKFLKFMKQVDDDNAVLEDPLAKSWSEEYAKSANDTLNIMNEVWDGQHVATNDDNSNSQFWDKLQDEWRKLAENDSHAEHPWVSEFENYCDPYKEYEFTENNPMSDTNSPLSEGKDLLEKGDLPGAVLCFEAAVRQDPSCAEAWQLLGTTQAENEQDPNAICALKKCLELEPNNLKVLMALAVSYTNENYHHQACQSLVTWLKNHPEYSSVVPADFQLSGEQHTMVQDLFIKVAQRQPINPDYEVQCGLGVLFNLSNEYDKAVDCFRVALNVKPEDSRLWNRLGATLANGNKPEEAVEAYHHALNISPGFIRARYNVGITCVNLGAYKEAAEHFLMALNQQARGSKAGNSKIQMSETIWATLRMCLSLMHRSDLRPAVDNRDLTLLNEAFHLNE
ncbi:peroxisomal targeting signal 1 receptor isoform X2 [Photinus pyralis]|uniref:Uncharacterized protein n=1 Tax=Photinus pyralis TaxID=7054 RepID=A0A1Y1LIS8_PHOPY|nr:peroxisomal targeting signal 1 receptor isoform X2 [Photinus pyralis]